MATWGYSGDSAPEYWGTLHRDFARCSEGRLQSPVDITEAVPDSTAPTLTFDYTPDGARVTNIGMTVMVMHEGRSHLTLGERVHTLVQVHSHTPAEHTVDGERFPLELHLVHSDDAGALAVVGVLFRAGSANPAIENLLAAAPASGEEALPAAPLDPAALLPPQTSHYRYPGSLTTPPCSEGVQWIVMATAGEVAEEQVERLVALTGNIATNRPVQPLGERTISRVG